MINNVLGGESELKRAQHQYFSVFVNNLPLELDQYGLRGIFRNAGQVSSIYIHPRRFRKDNSRFGFVRFRRREDAVKSIFLLDNAIIRGRRLFVRMAKPKRSKAIRKSHGLHGGEPMLRRVWRKKKQYQEHENWVSTVRLLVKKVSHSRNI